MNRALGLELDFAYSLLKPWFHMGYMEPRSEVRQLLGNYAK